MYVYSHGFAFEAKLHSISLSGLELAIYTRLASDSDLPASASQTLRSKVGITTHSTMLAFIIHNCVLKERTKTQAGIKGVHYHLQLPSFLFKGREKN